MSIAKRTGQDDSITEGWRAFDLFTNRHDLIRAFTSYLNEHPTPERIIFFYGEGGNGKSLLLKFLQEHCCKYIDSRNWEWVKGKPDSEFLEVLKNIIGAEDVPTAAVDFNPGPGGDDSIQDPFSALLTLRRALHHPRLHFPMFDFACAWHLATGGKLTEQQRQYLFMAEGTKLIAKIIDGISKTLYGAVATTVLAIYNKDLSQWFNLYTRRSGLNKEKIKEIQALAPESKLIDRLPRLFAEDLNTAMLIKGAPTKVALFFDAHESFWGIERKLSEELFFQRDEWLRTLLAHLEPSSGIVTVVAGRERPRWAEASKPGTIIPADCVDLRHVGPLPTEYAFEYLRKADIDDPAMRECLVSCSQVSTGQVHPLYLGLCADVVLAARDKGEILAPEEFQGTKQTADKATELIRRLLRYADDDIAYPVRALSACRAFDRDLYFKLGEALKLGVIEQSFQSLIRLSFVWRVERRGEGWYRIHDTLRRIFHEQSDEVTRNADKFLFTYYSLRKDTIAIVESVYHDNRLESENRIAGWLLSFRAGMEFARYDLCRLLLEVRSELKINRGADLGRVLDQEGTYFELIAKYEEAENSYQGAIAAFDEALTQDPESLEMYDLKGYTLNSLGRLYAEQTRHLDAYRSYRRALATYKYILKLAPNHPSRTRKGITLVSLGNLLSLRSKTKSATKYFKEAIAIFEDAIQHQPQDSNAHSDLGAALTALGNCQVEHAQDDEAVASLGKAISAYDRAITQLPILHRFYHNKGNALINLGEAHFRLRQYAKATQSYLGAVACFEQALRHSPDISSCWDGRGVALQHLGDVLIVCSRNDEAIDIYQKAVASFDEALRLTPEDISPNFNKATALESLGKLKSDKGAQEESAEIHRRAIAIFDSLTERVPDFINTYNNKRITPRRFSYSHILPANFDDVTDITRHAIATFDESIRCSTLSRWGDVLRGLAIGKTAQEVSSVYESLYQHFEIALSIKPDQEEVYYFWGNALQAHAGLMGGQEAEQLLTFAIEKYKTAASLNSDLFMVLSNWGATLIELAKVKSKESEVEADKLFEAACEKFDTALKAKPDLWEAQISFGAALSEWAKIKSGDEADALRSKAGSKFEIVANGGPDRFKCFALQNWGTTLMQQAAQRLRTDEPIDRSADPVATDLLNTAIGKFEKAHRIDPLETEYLVDWGHALEFLAVTIPWETMGQEAALLYSQAFDRFSLARNISPQDVSIRDHQVSSLSGWAGALREWAKAESEKDKKKAAKLLFLACEKLDKANYFDPSNAKVLRDWGIILYEVAEMIKGKKYVSRLTSAGQKLEVAMRRNPKDVKTKLYWSRALRAIAMTRMNDRQRRAIESLLESIRKSGYEV